MPMLRDIKQLRNLLGDVSYYRKFLPNMAKRVRPITALLNEGDTFSFTPSMEEAVRALIAEFAASLILVFPIGTLLSTSLDHSVCLAMPAPMASEQRSNRNSLTTLSVPSSMLVEQLSLINGTGLPWNSNPGASYGVSVAFAATYLACFP